MSEGKYPSEAESVILAAAEQYMKDAMAAYDPSHDAHHVQRVRNTALKLAKSVPQPLLDLLVVELAALFHDILDSKYTPELSLGAGADKTNANDFFLPFFQSLSSQLDLVATGQAILIAKIVECVSWKTEQKLRENGEWGTWHDTCVELHCVQDADRLDAIGAIGIMRCSAYSAVTNRPLVASEDDPLRGQSAIEHFHDKLLHVKDRMKTEQGRRLAETRHKFMLAFLNEIKDEIEG